MKRKRILAILIIIVIGGIVGASIGLYMWNKPHQNVEDSQAIVITATDLCKQYSDNEATAKAKYLGKALEVSGTVGEVTKNQDGSTMVVLQGADATTGVQCTMRDKDTRVENGKILTVKGFCADNTMFGVLLTDCVVKQ